ncbi:MAG TPA: hypothetical protein VFG30_27960 [Polyangiales bacterium]|nr:hypothetical protein [Polyangiales bacterium]
MHRTYSKFPYVETWNGLAADLLLVASREPPVHDVQTLRARLAEPTYARAMRGAWFSAGLEGLLLAHYVANRARARGLHGGARRAEHR